MQQDTAKRENVTDPLFCPSSKYFIKRRGKHPTVRAYFKIINSLMETLGVTQHLHPAGFWRFSSRIREVFRHLHPWNRALRNVGLRIYFKRF